MTADPRCDYLTKCALEALGASAPSAPCAMPLEAMHSAVHRSAALQDFLENSELRTLQVSVAPNAMGSSELLCSTSVGLTNPSGSAASTAVIFTKCTAEPLTAHNMPLAVVMSSLGESPLQTLQLNIKELFAPLLLKDPQWKKQLDGKTRQVKAI